jgi:hypothetical protein
MMSLWGLLFIGIMPMGQLALGSLFGIHAALAFGGVIAFATGLYAAVRVPSLREWRAPSHRHVRAPEQPPVTIPTQGVSTSYK